MGTSLWLEVAPGAGECGYRVTGMFSVIGGWSSPSSVTHYHGLHYRPDLQLRRF